MATDNELLAAGRLVGDSLAGIVSAVAHVHRTIADRTFAAIGPAGEPVRAAHDGIATGAYAAVRIGNSLAPRLGTTIAVMASTGEERTTWSDSARPSAVLGALNGLLGGRVAERYPELTVSMSFRHGSNGSDLALRPADLAAAFPAASRSIVVLVHGLCEHDRSWWRDATESNGGEAESYGSMLERDLGWTPVYLRYNTGLAVADNGLALDALMAELVDAWPVPVERIAFVGHSMGGLVIRSACHDADRAERRWAVFVQHIVCLGTPHLGAPLARGTKRLVPVLENIGVTQPLAQLLDDRSAGIRDLEQGLGTDADLPFLAHADWTFVGATVTRDRHHPLGQFLGDLLVHYPSATGADHAEHSSFELGNTTHLGGLDHFDLLHHPLVYEQIRHRLAAPGEPGQTSG